MTGKKPHGGWLRYWPRLLFIIPFAAINAVPALVYGAGAMGFFAVPYTILIFPILYLIFYLIFPKAVGDRACPRSRHRGRLCARTLQEPAACAGRGADRDRRHHALHRATARRHAGRDRWPRISSRRISRTPAADHRLHRARSLHLYQRLARACVDRCGQGYVDLRHHLCGCRDDPSQAWWL